MNILLDWLKMNAATLVVGALVLVSLFFVIRSMVSKRRSGTFSCGCCDSCPTALCDRRTSEKTHTS
ncbi:MAG TPA: FeoB-associated Cys-rich membrane protein [Fastidiosipila sp.]|nr:FeoB-associated Cys-rich membrane protein [Fastidiosipila sp.]